MFGPDQLDPNFDHLVKAFGLNVNSFIVGNYPKLVSIGRGSDVKIYFGTNGGEDQFAYLYVEDFDLSSRTLSGYHYYTEAEAKVFLLAHWPKLAKLVARFLPEKSGASKISQEQILLPSNHYQSGIEIDTVCETVSVSSWYDYEFESHRQTHVCTHFLDVLDFTVHKLTYLENAKTRYVVRDFFYFFANIDFFRLSTYQHDFCLSSRDLDVQQQLSHFRHGFQTWAHSRDTATGKINLFHIAGSFKLFCAVATSDHDLLSSATFNAKARTWKVKSHHAFFSLCITCFSADRYQGTGFSRGLHRRRFQHLQCYLQGWKDGDGVPRHHLLQSQQTWPFGDLRDWNSPTQSRAQDYVGLGHRARR